MQNTLQKISIAEKTYQYHSLAELEKTGVGNIQHWKFFEVCFA